MEFIKYPSIDYNIQNPTEETVSVDWAITEKVHGCNFQLDFNINTKEITACRRNAILNPEEKFYDFQKIIIKYAISMVLLSKKLGESFRVYGELFGGGYSETPKKGVIQREIHYCEDIDFIVFDILTTKWLDWDNVKSLCKDVGFKVVPELCRGPFEEVVKFDPNDLLTRIPALYNLPDIPNNIMEGIVLRPSIEPKDRQMYKVRTKNYLETKYAKKSKLPKTKDTEILSQVAYLQQYITVNRFNSVRSKELPIQSMKEISKYIDLMIEDIKEQKHTTVVNENAYSQIKKTIAMLVRKEIEQILRSS